MNKQVSTYEKRRTQIRLNALVASLLLFTSAFLAIIFGSDALATMWITGNQTMGIAIMSVAMFVAAVCIIFWLKIILKLKTKLAELQGGPSVAVSA